jgi:DNA-binding GntR family transcriptional regulator
MSINKQTLSQKIVQELKRRILEGELHTGQRIWAADLVEELGVSMAPVKDALIVLQGEGLIVNVPRRGAIVREFSLKEVVDLYDIRAMVECEAIRRGFDAGKINDEMIDELVQLNELLGKERMGDTFIKNEKAYELDWVFHNVLLSGCDNLLLVDWYKKLNTQSQIIRLASYNAGPRAEQTYLEHKAIITGLQKGDVEQAIVAVKAHLFSIETAFRVHVDCCKDAENGYRQLRARRG